MPSAPKSNRNRIILIVILIVCITLITLYVRESDDGPLHKVQNFFIDLVSPVTNAFSKVFGTIKDGFVNVWHLPSLAREKNDLQKQVDTLTQQLTDIKRKYKKEVESLKEQVMYAEENPDQKPLAADIIAQSPDNWQRVMIINRGMSDGVRKYMAVVNESGLVGRVISAGSRSSVVQMITDSRSGIGARDLRNSETGVVEGQNEETLRFVPMNDEADMKVGDILVTSGMGGTVPAGIPVGRVSSMQKGTKSHAKVVEVTPSVRFSRLDNVMVILTPLPESLILREQK